MDLKLVYVFTKMYYVIVFKHFVKYFPVIFPALLQTLDPIVSNYFYYMLNLATEDLM